MGERGRGAESAKEPFALRRHSVGDVLMMGLRQYHPVAADAFDELRTGLDHLAFAVCSQAELESWEMRLRDRRITFSPIAETPIGSVDNIQLELCLPAT